MTARGSPTRPAARTTIFMRSARNAESRKDAAEPMRAHFSGLPGDNERCRRSGMPLHRRTSRSERAIDSTGDLQRCGNVPRRVKPNMVAGSRLIVGCGNRLGGEEGGTAASTCRSVRTMRNAGRVIRRIVGVRATGARMSRGRLPGAARTVQVRDGRSVGSAPCSPPGRAGLRPARPRTGGIVLDARSCYL
jgi:hypothetical protein